jgi:hypothetical protein
MEKLIVAQLAKKFPPFMKSVGSLITVFTGQNISVMEITKYSLLFNQEIWERNRIKTITH